MFAMSFHSQEHPDMQITKQINQSRFYAYSMITTISGDIE